MYNKIFIVLMEDDLVVLIKNFGYKHKSRRKYWSDPR